MSQHDFLPEAPQTHVGSVGRKDLPLIVRSVPKKRLRCQRAGVGIVMAILGNGIILSAAKIGPLAGFIGMVATFAMVGIADFFMWRQGKNGFFLRVYHDRIEYGNGWSRGLIDIEEIDQIIEKEKNPIAILKSGKAVPLPRGKELNDAYRALRNHVLVSLTILD